MQVVADLRVNAGSRLGDMPTGGHNRWHHDIVPALQVASGDVVVLETRDAADGQLFTERPDWANFDGGAIHPLTGPVHVAGAAPGDVLEVEILEVVPGPRGFTAEIPGLGIFPSRFEEPWHILWDTSGPCAMSEALPGVCIPAAPFPGVVGVAPDRTLLRSVHERERRLDGAAGPDPAGAVPGVGPSATEGLRTIPPRENGGNMDMRQLTAGSTILLPVLVEGALLSVGDVHYAQGEGEICGTAIEVSATLRLRLTIRKSGSSTFLPRRPTLVCDGSLMPSASIESRPHIGFTGLSLVGEDVCPGDGLTAVRNAVDEAVRYLATRGLDERQALAVCSVAADVRISQWVNEPMVLATVLLPLDIFEPA